MFVTATTGFSVQNSLRRHQPVLAMPTLVTDAREEVRIMNEDFLKALMEKDPTELWIHEVKDYLGHAFDIITNSPAGQLQAQPTRPSNNNPPSQPWPRLQPGPTKPMTSALFQNPTTALSPAPDSAAEHFPSQAVDQAQTLSAASPPPFITTMAPTHALNPALFPAPKPSLSSLNNIATAAPFSQPLESAAIPTPAIPSSTDFSSRPTPRKAKRMNRDRDTEDMSAKKGPGAPTPGVSPFLAASGDGLSVQSAPSFNWSSAGQPAWGSGSVPSFGSASSGGSFLFNQTSSPLPAFNSAASGGGFFGTASTLPAFTPASSSAGKFSTSGASSALGGGLFGGSSTVPAFGGSAVAPVPEVSGSGSGFQFALASTSAAATAQQWTGGTTLNSVSIKPADAGAQQRKDDDEDEVEAPESPSLKNDPELGVQVVYETRLAMYIQSDKGWMNMGIGKLILRQAMADQGESSTKPTTRILFRTEVGRLLMNAVLYSGISPSVKGNKVTVILFSSHNGEGQGKTVYCLKAASSEGANDVRDQILKYAPE